MKIKESHTYKLLVEGNDDQHVVWALCEKHNIPESFDVIDCESVENVLKAFEVRLKIADNNQRIGIVVDADINLRYIPILHGKMLLAVRWDRPSPPTF